MLTVTTTPEFADWYRSLSDRDAEEVATGISLIESLGPERSPPNSSELLLWYQSSTEPLRYFSSDSLEFAQRARRMVDHLASRRTLERLGEVSSARAVRFAREISLVAERAARWRRGLGIRDEAEMLEVQQAYRSALGALDLREPAAAAPKQSLRELTLSDAKPGLRLLYGVEIESKRALLILGETLDRRAYGPSVRGALAVWKQFLASQADAHVLAAGSGK